MNRSGFGRPGPTTAPSLVIIRDADQAGRLPVGSIVAALTLDDPTRPAVAHKVEISVGGDENLIVWRMLETDDYWTTEDLWPGAGAAQRTADGAVVHSVVLLWRPEWTVLAVRPEWADTLVVPDVPVGDYKRPEPICPLDHEHGVGCPTPPAP